MAGPSLQKVEQLFLAAIDLPADRRARFLEQSCGPDSQLRAAVEKLLHHDGGQHDTPGVLSSPIVRIPPEGAATLTELAGGSLAGSRSPLPDIPGYEVLGEVGRGGMGVVYKARQRGLKRFVAIKMLLSTAEVSSIQLARFRGEVEALSRLQHPNIVQIFEIGEHEGRPFFAMEYVPGPSLAQRLEGTPLDFTQAAGLAETLARAVHAVHECGIIHRDLKPANVLLGAEEPGTDSQAHPLAPLGTPKITDFGLAKDQRGAQQLTQAGLAIGTPSYMAPEQARGDVGLIGPATDLYALGAILYEMLTGSPPFDEATPAETIAKLVSEEPVSPRRRRPRLPRDLSTICLKCLAKDPGKRYPSALELAEDLRRFRQKAPIRARPIGPAERCWRWCERQPIAAAALASSAVLLVALTITGLLLYNARLRETLAKTERESRDQHERIVHLTVNLAQGHANDGESYLAALWLLEALRLDEGNPERRQEHWEQIGSILQDAPQLLQLWQAEAPILCVRLTDAGCWVAAATNSGVLRVWDVLAGEPISPELRHRDGVVLAELSPDGRFVVTADGNNVVRIWDIATGQPRAVWPRLAVRVERFVFQAGGRLLVSQLADRRIIVWDTQTGQRTDTSGPSERAPTWSTISDNGRWLFEVDADHRAQLSELGVNRKRPLPVRLPREIRKAVFSAEGDRLAVVGQDNMASIFDLASGKPVGVPCWLPEATRDVAFHSGGKGLVATGTDHSALMWRLGAADVPAAPLGRPGAVSKTRVSPDGKGLLTCGDGGTRIWDAVHGRARTPSLKPRDHVRHAVFSPDGRQLVLVGQDGTVRLWALESTGPRPELQPSDLVDLTQAVTGGRVDERARLIALDGESQLRVWQKTRPRFGERKTRGTSP